MTPHSRSWAIARHRIQMDTAAVIVLWVPFLLVAVAISAAVGIYGTLSTSVWEQATQIPRWFAGGIGVYLTAVYLPLYIAHGLTRRQFATQVPVIVAVLSTVLAALITVGFAIERAVYALGGWPQALSRSHLFDTPDQYAVIGLEFWLVFAVWIVAGMLVGAGFYRRPVLGFVLIPVVLAVVAFAETTVGTGIFGPLPEPLLTAIGLDAAAPSLFAAIVSCLGVIVVAAGLTWLVVRDLPIRSQTA